MSSRRTRLIVVAITFAVLIALAVALAALESSPPRLLILMVLGLSTLFAVSELLNWLLFRLTAQAIARVRAETGTKVAGALLSLGGAQRAELRALMGAEPPKDGQVVIAPTAAALQVWTFDSNPVALVSVPWQRIGSVTSHGRTALLWPAIEIPYVSDEKVRGIARLALLVEKTDLATPRDAAEFVAALNAIRPSVS